MMGGKTTARFIAFIFLFIFGGCGGGGDNVLSTPTVPSVPVITVARFIDQGNGTIYDTENKRTWLKDANCFGILNYGDATYQVESLANGKCGLTDGSKPYDWRIPYAGDFEVNGVSIYNISTLKLAGFINVQPAYYWAGGTNANNQYSFDMYNGVVAFSTQVDLNYNYDGSGYVWPVR